MLCYIILHISCYASIRDSVATTPHRLLETKAQACAPLAGHHARGHSLAADTMIYVSVCVCIYIYIYMYIVMNIYIYIEREREIDIHTRAVIAWRPIDRCCQVRRTRSDQNSNKNNKKKENTNNNSTNNNNNNKQGDAIHASMAPCSVVSFSLLRDAIAMDGYSSKGGAVGGGCSG